MDLQGFLWHTCMPASRAPLVNLSTVRYFYVSGWGQAAAAKHGRKSYHHAHRSQAHWLWNWGRVLHLPDLTPEQREREGADAEEEIDDTCIFIYIPIYGNNSNEHNKNGRPTEDSLFQFNEDFNIIAVAIFKQNITHQVSLCSLGSGTSHVIWRHCETRHTRVRLCDLMS